MANGIGNSYPSINVSNFLSTNNQNKTANPQYNPPAQITPPQYTNNIQPTQKPQSTKQLIANSLLSIALLAAGINIVIKSMQKAHSINKKELETMWSNLANETGIRDMALPDGLKNLTQKIKTCIEHPQLSIQRGGKQINSILLYGPPGTGKTTYAKALAKMFPGSKFASLDLTALNSEFNGVSQKNIKAAFNEITSKAKSNPDKKIFVFIDEIDSVMMADSGKNAKLSNDVLNSFKTCFTEKLEKHKNIITIGATNLEIDTEKAVTQNGKKLDKPMLDRFEEKILVDLPTSSQIKQSLISHYKDCTFVADDLKHDSEKLDTLCNFLSKKEHNISFRTLNSIYSDTAASIEDTTSKVTFDDLIETVKKRSEEFNIKDEELTEFLNSIQQTT